MTMDKLKTTTIKIGKITYSFVYNKPISIEHYESILCQIGRKDQLYRLHNCSDEEFEEYLGLYVLDVDFTCPHCLTKEPISGQRVEHHRIGGLLWTGIKRIDVYTCSNCGKEFTDEDLLRVKNKNIKEYERERLNCCLSYSKDPRKFCFSSFFYEMFSEDGVLDMLEERFGEIPSKYTPKKHLVVG